MEYKKVTALEIEHLKNIFPAGKVYINSEILEDYTHDEMPEYGKYWPEVVVEAANAVEVSEIMKFASANSIPVTPRGSGTGLCGGAVAINGGILLSLSRMNKILEIDEENMTATVEPGVLLNDLIKTLNEYKLLYPPDPGEKGATVGGNAMTNAGGMKAVKYGVTRDNIKGMEVVLPDGNMMNLGGKVAKNSSGYSLKDLFIGSEGTLCIVTKLILGLIPAPAVTISLLVPFESIETCIEAVPKLIKSRINPTTLEFMQRQVIEAAEEFLGKKFPHKTSEAYLLISFDGNSKEDLEKIYMDAAEVCLEAGAEDVLVSDTSERQELIWSMRGAFLEAIKSSTTGIDECDVVVPRNKIAEFVRFVDTIEKKYEIRLRSFGHAGDGNIHVYVCRDSLDDNTWNERLGNAMKAMYDKAYELGGQVSGEHGIGHAKIKYLSKSSGDTCMKVMQAVKLAIDPGNILNPGKVCGCIQR